MRYGPFACVIILKIMLTISNNNVAITISNNNVAITKTSLTKAIVAIHIKKKCIESWGQEL